MPWALGWLPARPPLPGSSCTQHLHRNQGGLASRRSRSCRAQLQGSGSWLHILPSHFNYGTDSTRRVVLSLQLVAELEASDLHPAPFIIGP